MLEGLESANAYSTISLDAPDSATRTRPPSATRSASSTTPSRVSSTASRSSRCSSGCRRGSGRSCARFFGNLTQSQIAADLGISQMHVSRLLARTLTQLRDGLTADK